MLRISLVTAALASLLAGCQTMQQHVADRTRLVCFEAGFGETSPRHDECMRTVQPVGMAMERKQRIDEGLDLIEKGLARLQITCVGGSNVVTCSQ